MNELYRKMISAYSAVTDRDVRMARYMVAQQVILSGLYQGGFFEKAAFYGGSCLRIFHRLERFSEDMEFALVDADPDFDFEPYLIHVINEFLLVGRRVDVKKREPLSFDRANATSAKVLIYDFFSIEDKPLRIRVIVDVNPPERFETEQHLALQPRSFMTRCFTLPDLFAGKAHALVHRRWGNFSKGRDWFDFEWYVKNATPLDFNYIHDRILRMDGQEVTREQFIEQLVDVFAKANIAQVKSDIQPFLRNPHILDIWSSEYFINLAKLIRWK